MQEITQLTTRWPAKVFASTITTLNLLESVFLTNCLMPISLSDAKMLIMEYFSCFDSNIILQIHFSWKFKDKQRENAKNCSKPSDTDYLKYLFTNATPEM